MAMLKALTIRLPQEILNLYKMAARQEGRSMSSWIRHTLTEEARKVLKLTR